MKIELNNLSKLDKYRENLLVSDDAVFSYLTRVAEIDHEKREINPLGWWSVTTSKHINYVAREYDYKVTK
tara:strand:- start:1058 stop:1267 length:210 start_codon:yes stop_codon:yes gene_type:complete